MEERGQFDEMLRSLDSNPSKFSFSMDDEIKIPERNPDLSASEEDDEEIEKEEEEVEVKPKSVKKEKEKPTKEETGDEDLEVDEDETVTTTTEEVETLEGLDEYETQIATYVGEKLSEKLGTSFGEFTKVDDVIDELAKIVEENSKPEFASEEIEQLDEYVRKGGDLRKFYQEVYGTVDVDSVDLDNEKDQKAVVKENLKLLGYSEKQIERKLERYEDQGILSEEAEEALETLKEKKSEKQKKLLEEQENFHRNQVKTQQKFISDVQGYIKGLKNIKGEEISDSQKTEILNYILKVDSKDGLTGYRRDSSWGSKDLIEFMVESAFFRKMGDQLLNKATKKGASTSLNNIKAQLAQKGKLNKKSTSHSGTDNMDALDALSRMFTRRKG